MDEWIGFVLTGVPTIGGMITIIYKIGRWNGKLTTSIDTLTAEIKSMKRDCSDKMQNMDEIIDRKTESIQKRIDERINKR